MILRSEKVLRSIWLFDPSLPALVHILFAVLILHFVLITLVKKCVAKLKVIIKLSELPELVLHLGKTRDV